MNPNFITLNIPRIRTAGSYCGSIFNILRKLHIVFHGGYTNLDSHQECTSVLFFPHPHRHLLSFVFLVIDILTSVK